MFTNIRESFLELGTKMMSPERKHSRRNSDLGFFQAVNDVIMVLNSPGQFL